jgi:transcription-repair coupling factor (superfamily II helicase)
MVTEVVAEMKGEPIEMPNELKLDIQVSAFLPNDYVPTEDLRLEAYRRLSEVKTFEEVEDVRREWLDRFGPLPTQADILLAVGALRAACHTYSIKELTIMMNTARISPVELKNSQQMAVQRLSRTGKFKGMSYREDAKQLVVPLQGPPQNRKGTNNDQVVYDLQELLAELFADQ